MLKDIAIIIQARMGSTRLPGKILLPFCQDTVLGFLITRLKGYGIKKICIATSKNKENDCLVDFCLQKDIFIYRGDEMNVFDRFQEIAKTIEERNIIRLTGDNPLIEENLILSAYYLHNSTNADLTTTRKIVNEEVISYLPKGQTIDILKKDTLLKIDQTKLDSFDREHVISYFFKGDYKIEYLKSFENSKHGDKKLSIDTYGDYNRINSYAKKIYCNHLLK